MNENTLNIYTDGSSLPKPRRGGVGMRFIAIDAQGIELEEWDFEPPGYKSATNNQMEIQACILALKEALGAPVLDLVGKVTIFTDSLYVKENYTRALFQWPQTRWCNSNGRPILNVPHWKNLVSQIKRIKQRRKRFDIEWVKGHSKNVHNKAADAMAKRSAKNARHPAQIVVDVRRATSKTKLQSGSIGMNGQRISIRIVTSEYLQYHRLHRYHIEVLSKASPYYHHRDYVTSAVSLRAGRKYHVRLNKDPKDPRIMKLLSEIP